MKPVLLKDGIYWVGAVDYNLRNFHRYSRSPQGSTYNAYIVKDQKNVLFDTVDEEYCDELLKRISEIMDPTEIDYIVCNHMEKDHAGSIERIVEVCRPEKIFCSAITSAVTTTSAGALAGQHGFLFGGRQNLVFKRCVRTKRCDKQPLC